MVRRRAAPGPMANSESPRLQWINLWHNVADVWANGFGAAFLVSAVVGAAVAACTVLLALPAGFALASRVRPRGRSRPRPAGRRPVPARRGAHHTALQPPEGCELAELAHRADRFRGGP